MNVGLQAKFYMVKIHRYILSRLHLLNHVVEDLYLVNAHLYSLGQFLG